MGNCCCKRPKKKNVTTYVKYTDEEVNNLIEEMALNRGHYPYEPSVIEELR